MSAMPVLTGEAGDIMRTVQAQVLRQTRKFGLKAGTKFAILDPEVWCEV
jgi:hypothetical protein